MSTFDLTKPADSSESEDDDYVPSAEESEGDESDAENDAGSDAEAPAGKKPKGTKKKQSSRKRKGGIHLEGDVSPAHDSPDKVDDVEELVSALTPEEEKKKADDLWSDFLRDVEPIPRKRTVPAASAVSQEPSKPSSSTTSPQEVPEKKVKITQMLEFAGETIKVDKEVAADSKEARLFAQKEETEQTKSPVLPGKRKPIGVGNVLNQLFNKKQKISTLEKSKLDWDNYKKTEGLVEDLQSHNRGKDGYLEKQAFLQRADVRQFEIEKNLRAKNRSSHYL
ncbi:craniofacial development protein 1 isoform X1 [Rhipicephalus sanguineus]|uniref:craniofacial development protein 1 isoform X1 n=1 Tax=Rhipicephalus sanguineus TaxID=34632 RepID=UPI001893FE61|nr:craniofacial development protein 1 isoform X1 [Rhipicephalus sanguineus]